MGIKFGPAGLGPVKTAKEVLEQYRKLGLEACEIAFTYSIYIKPNEAGEIGKKAKEEGIELSIHAPYWLNLNSSKEDKIDASKKRILDCCEIGEKLGAKVVVFHAGFYGKPLHSSRVIAASQEEVKERAYQTIKKGVHEIMQEIKKRGLKIKIAPETMGKVNVFGSVEEIRKLVDETGCSFCLDFAHILAREKKVDFDKVIRMFPEDEWHVHFSGIVYGEKGEKHHKPTETEEWRVLLNNLPKDKKIRIINESPTHVEDSVNGMRILKEIS